MLKAAAGVVRQPRRFPAGIEVSSSRAQCWGALTGGAGADCESAATTGAAYCGEAAYWADGAHFAGAHGGAHFVGAHGSDLQGAAGAHWRDGLAQGIEGAHCGVL